jgi:hypothetical protein
MRGREKKVSFRDGGNESIAVVRAGARGSRYVHGREYEDGHGLSSTVTSTTVSTVEDSEIFQGR